MKIKKAIIPTAGKGTRFLPATKQIPKEMLPIIDTPMIHYVVQEAIDAGIEQVIFVTSSGKESIENYFDRNLELEFFLSERQKEEELQLIKNIGSKIDVITIRQKEQLGLGHAVLSAKAIVGDEDVAVLLGDEILLNKPPVISQLIKTYEKFKKSVIGVMEVPKQDVNRYGIVAGEFSVEDSKTVLMKEMIEKPKVAEAPSNLATPGRYIFKNEIFDMLERIPRGKGGEYQLTDAINLLAMENKVVAHIFEGERFDTGSVEGYLDATIDFALRNKNYSKIMKEIILNKKEKYDF